MQMMTNYEELEVEEDESYENSRDKNAFLTVDQPCPRCNSYPLEYQVFGYEKVVFCPRCEYSKTIDL